MKFPTYKYKIIYHVKKITNDENIIALFYTLFDSLEYKDLKHIKNILQSNIPANNSSSKTKNPDELNVNPLSRENNLATDEKNDSMRQYICNKCGKPFLTREDLKIHQDFEGQ